MFKRTLILILVAGLAGTLGACSARQVKRVDVNKPTDLSGYWNDTDAQMVAEEMIKESLSNPWAEVFTAKNGRKPVVIVGPVHNRSQEHINTEVFTKSLERALINSGKVVFVAAPEERQDIRAEREDQQKGYTDPATMAAMGKELGADYMLLGSLNSVKDEVKRQYTIFYQANLELIDIETNRKVWIGQKEIKKTVTIPRFGL